MKHNYKIKVRDKEITDEQILAHKNFEKVLKDYRGITEPLYRKPLYKNPRSFLGVVLVGVIGYLVYLAVLEEEQMKKQQAATTEGKGKVEAALPPPPMMKPMVAFTSSEPAKRSFNPIEKIEWNLPDHSVLRVPENAFVDSAGNPVEGKVTLTYHRYGDLVDFMAARLPLVAKGAPAMRLKANEIVEIRAFAGPMPLQLRPEKRMGLELATISGLDSLDTNRVVMGAKLVAGSSSWEVLPGPLPDKVRLIRMEEAGIRKLDDGFGVSTDENNGDSDWEIPPSSWLEDVYTHVLELDEPGFWGLASAEGEMPSFTARVRLVAEDGSAIVLKEAHQLVWDLSQVYYSWPASGDKGFPVRIFSGINQVLCGLSDSGKLVVVSGEALTALEKDTDRVQELKAEILPANQEGLDQVKKRLYSYGGR